jgi:hypothetical protein
MASGVGAKSATVVGIRSKIATRACGSCGRPLRDWEKRRAAGRATDAAVAGDSRLEGGGE